MCVRMAFCRGFPCAKLVMGIFDIGSHGSLVWLTTTRYDQFFCCAVARWCRHIPRKDIAMRLFAGPCTMIACMPCYAWPSGARQQPAAGTAAIRGTPSSGQAV
jgi:hypothetical protein